MEKIKKELFFFFIGLELIVLGIIVGKESFYLGLMSLLSGIFVMIISIHKVSKLKQRE